MSLCKKKMQKKIKQMTMVRTFQACETIVQIATVKGDEDLLRVTSAVNNDLGADEARYHKDCRATIVSKNNLRYDGRKETYYDIAIQKLPDYMSTDLDGGKAFSMSTVIVRYNDYMNEQHMSLDSCTTRRHKLRLKKHFGDNIAFHSHRIALNPSFCTQAPYPFKMSSTLPTSATPLLPRECLANSPQLRWWTAAKE